MLEITHLTEYLSNLPLLQVPSSLLQTALNEALRIGQSGTGMIAFFDFEEGREAGEEIYLLRQFFAYEAARARTTLLQRKIHSNDQNPMTLWLPKSPVVRPISSATGLRRVLILPLQNPSNGQANGFILVLLPATEGNTGSLTLSNEELLALSYFGRATGNAWYSLRSLTTVSRRLEDLVLLNEIATAITSNRNLSELLKQIMTTTSQLLRCSACTLMLLDAKTDELVFTIPSGEKGEVLKEYRQPAGRGISGYVARLGEPVIVNDVSKDPRFNSAVDATTGFKTSNIMCAPLIVRDKLIGVIEVINKLDKSPFNNNDLAILTTLAAQSAIAIENAQLYADLKDERDRIVAKEEEVRRELGRDLHDGPAQVISGIAMRIGFIKKLFENEPDKVMGQLDEVEKTALRVSKDIRTLMFGLRPLMLETQGLIPTLETYVEKLQIESFETHLQVSGFGDNEEHYIRLPYNTEATVFIITQEAVNNIRKHAQPKNVWIVLERGIDQTTVIIRDDGKGFDSRAVLDKYEERGSFGLLNMRERARVIQASCDIFSQPGQGTSIVLTIPHTDPHQVKGTNGVVGVTGPLPIR